MMKWGIRKRGTLLYYVSYSFWSENADLAYLFASHQEAAGAVERLSLSVSRGAQPATLEYVPFVMKYTPMGDASPA